MSETRRIASVIPVSREMLLAHGLVEPTDEERAERSRWLAEWAERQRVQWAAYRAAKVALDALTDPGVRAALALHAPDETGHEVTCSHDYADTEMGDKAEWPCETVEAIGKAHGIALPLSPLEARP